ncbi:hypothetical protein U0070_026847 [Myodes glareolus]|uniref:Uncharacterized protein n=1 Tax=Myodes glareolus TaxID=447135 RepID=A0AAW0K2F6_MYOGA
MDSLLQSRYAPVFSQRKEHTILEGPSLNPEVALGKPRNARPTQKWWTLRGKKWEEIEREQGLMTFTFLLGRAAWAGAHLCQPKVLFEILQQLQ